MIIAGFTNGVRPLFGRRFGVLKRVTGPCRIAGDALALAQQGQEDVLGADVVVPERQCLPQGQFQHFLGPRRERYRARDGYPAIGR